MRLRHGHFRAECYGDIVYEASTRGDGLFKCEERDFHLNKACQAIQDKLDQREAPEESIFEIEHPQQGNDE